MRQETLEQILKVISVAVEYYSPGNGIDGSYQYAVRRVSNEYGVSYQTIGDACRRRLGLDHIGEFKSMLKASFEGDVKKLQDVLVNQTSVFYHDRINEFFSKLANGLAAVQAAPKKPGSPVTYTIQLKKSDSDVLLALAHLLNDQPGELLVKVAVDALKDRMKKIANQL